MAVLFGRKYELYIGEHRNLVEQSVPFSVIVPDGAESVPGLPTEDHLTIPKGILITDLRIKARVVDSKQGASSNINSSWIEVYGLSEENQQKIKVDQTLILKAGYEQDKSLPVIYAGQVTRVSTRKQGTEVVTKIQVGTAAAVRRNVRVARTPNREETVQEIIEWFASIAAKNGIPTGRVETLIEFSYPYGYAVVGNLFARLEEFCEYHNLQTYISLGKLYVEPIDYTAFVDTVHIESHNVKGTIRAKKDGTGKTSIKSSTGTSTTAISDTNVSSNTAGKVDGVSNGVDPKQGIEFDTFLDGSISSAKRVRVEFGDFKGDYKVNSIAFKLDSRGKDWDTSLSCERMEG